MISKQCIQQMMEFALNHLDLSYGLSNVFQAGNGKWRVYSRPMGSQGPYIPLYFNLPALIGYILVNRVATSVNRLSSAEFVNQGLDHWLYFETDSVAGSFIGDCLIVWTMRANNCSMFSIHGLLCCSPSCALLLVKNSCYQHDYLHKLDSLQTEPVDQSVSGWDWSPR